MKDAANLLSAMQTVCRRGRGLPARGYGIAAKNRWWRDAAWVLERLYATVLLVVQGTLNGSVEASGLKIGLHANVDRRRAVLLKPEVQFLDFARRERSDGAFNLLDGV